MIQPSGATVIVKEWSVVQTKQHIVKTPQVVDQGIKEPRHLLNDKIEENEQQDGHVEPTVTFAKLNAEGTTKNGQSPSVETANVAASKTHEAKLIPETREDEVVAKPSAVSEIRKPQCNNPTKSSGEAENGFPAQVKNNISWINQSEQGKNGKKTPDKNDKRTIDQATTVAVACKQETLGSRKNEQRKQGNGKTHCEEIQTTQDENGYEEVVRVPNSKCERDDEDDNEVTVVSENSVGVYQGRAKTEGKAEYGNVYRPQSGRSTTESVADKKDRQDDKGEIKTNGEIRRLNDDGKGWGGVANAQPEFSSGIGNEKTNAERTVERDCRDGIKGGRVEELNAENGNDDRGNTAKDEASAGYSACVSGANEVNANVTDFQRRSSRGDDNHQVEQASLETSNDSGDCTDGILTIMNIQRGIRAMNDETRNARKDEECVEKATNAKHPSDSNSNNAKCAESKIPELTSHSTDDQVKAAEANTEQQSEHQTGVNEAQATNGNRQSGSAGDDENSRNDKNALSAENAEHGHGIADKEIETVNAKSESGLPDRKDEVIVPNSGHDCNDGNDQEKKSNDVENGEDTLRQNNVGGDGTDGILTTNIRSRSAGKNDDDKFETVGCAKDGSASRNDRCRTKAVNGETRNTRKDEKCPGKMTNAEHSNGNGNNSKKCTATKKPELAHDSTVGQVAADETNHEQGDGNQIGKHEAKSTNMNSRNGNDDDDESKRKEKNGLKAGNAERGHGNGGKEIEKVNAESGNGANDNNDEVIVPISGEYNGGNDSEKESNDGEKGKNTTHQNKGEKTKSSESNQPKTLKEISQGFSGNNPQSMAVGEEDEDASNKTEKEVGKFSSKTSISCSCFRTRPVSIGSPINEVLFLYHIQKLFLKHRYSRS